MNKLLKQLLRVILQICIGISTLILTLKYSWYIPIIFIIMWATLWVGYDALMRTE